MFNPTALVIDSFVEQLQTMYQRVYGLLEPGYPGIIGFIGRVALENIANSDAPYHDVNHTIMVTLVGQEILRGKHIVQGGITPRDWLHFMVSLLCHDIGYVRGVCHGDGGGRYVMNSKGETTELPPGATDAALTPYHVNRSKLFVRERFGKVSLTPIDTLVIEGNIEHTRFPVPTDDEHSNRAWCAPPTSSASSPTPIISARSPRSSRSSTRPALARSWATATPGTCARPTRAFSGRRSRPISSTGCATCA
jgi:hypothetical protein